jgi:hypothetical protein
MDHHHRHHMVATIMSEQAGEWTVVEHKSGTATLYCGDKHKALQCEGGLAANLKWIAMNANAEREKFRQEAVALEQMAVRFNRCLGQLDAAIKLLKEFEGEYPHVARWLKELK